MLQASKLQCPRPERLHSPLLMSDDVPKMVFARDFLNQLAGKYTTCLSACPVLNQHSADHNILRFRRHGDEGWKLDEDFFRDMACWDKQHQDSTFLKVMETVQDAMITCKPFMKLIPNTPFPAHALVLALSHFLHFGVVRSYSLPSNKPKVFTLVDELSGWIANMEAKFEDGRGKFSWRARRNPHPVYALCFCSDVSC
jgi:hypothetical protein